MHKIERVTSATRPESHTMNQPSSSQTSHCLFRGEGNTYLNRYYQEALVPILALALNILGRFLTQSFWGGARSWFLICTVVYNIKGSLAFSSQKHILLFVSAYSVSFLQPSFKVVYVHRVALHVYRIQHSNQGRRIFLVPLVEKPFKILSSNFFETYCTQS